MPVGDGPGGASVKATTVVLLVAAAGVAYLATRPVDLAAVRRDAHWRVGAERQRERAAREAEARAAADSGGGWIDDALTIAGAGVGFVFGGPAGAAAGGAVGRGAYELGRAVF